MVSEVNGRDLQMWEKQVNLKSTKAHGSYLNAFALCCGVDISQENFSKMSNWIERNV